MCYALRMGGGAAILTSCIGGLLLKHFHNTSTEYALCLIAAILVAASYHAQRKLCVA